MTSQTETPDSLNAKFDTLDPEAAEMPKPRTLYTQKELQEALDPSFKDVTLKP